VCGLGVLVNPDLSVSAAGGYLLQLLPGAGEETISRVEENIKKLPPVSTMIRQGMTPEQLLERVLDGFDVEITDRMPCSFACNCSKERVEKALISIGKKELQEMIDEDKPIEVNCHFCGKTYKFDVDELKKMEKKSR